MSKETFKVHKKENPFTMVENSLINNNNLSWSAKGVLIYLLSKPDNWKVYKADIVNHATNGVSSVKSIIKELKKAGYVTLAKVLDCKGRIVEWRYDIYDEPVDTPIETHYTIKLDECGHEVDIVMEDIPEYKNEQKSPEVENRPVDNCIPEVDFPLVESPPVENRPTSNTKYNNTKNNNTQSNQTTRLSREEYKKQIKEQLDFHEWKKSANKQNIKAVEAIIRYIVDLYASSKKQITINGEKLETADVQQKFSELSLEKILQVCEKIQQTNKIKNIRMYTWTCLYNSIDESNIQVDIHNFSTIPEQSYDLDEFERRGFDIPSCQ